MRVVIQRSLKSDVKIDHKIVGSIEHGLVILVGFTYDDEISDIEYIVNKIINLRIFNDDNGIMNKSLLETNGSILSISQFTLYADIKKGRRPSYVAALEPTKAIVLYDMFNQSLINKGIKVATGIFGADMQVNINNDGPVTIVMESRN